MSRRGPARPAGALESVVTRMQGKRLLVVADLVADEFVYTRVQRVSREAPVLILEHHGSEVRPGGGAIAISNLGALGARPVPVGVVGRDAHGRQLRDRLAEAGIGMGRVASLVGYSTPVKSRVLAGGTHSAKQQVVRIDRIEKPGRGAASHVRKALREFRGRIDGILVSDYGLGLVTLGVVRAALALARSRGVPITVDSRHQLLSFRGMTAVTPNEPEVEEALGIRIGHDVRELERAGRRLLRRLKSEAVLITRGADGMALFQKRRRTVHLPIYGSDQVADVTGAGDTVIATLTLALIVGAEMIDAAMLANYAAGIVVQKMGTASVSPGELLAAIEADHTQ